MRQVTVAATQMSCVWDVQANIQNAEKLVRQAAEQGAQIILIQELFATPYFVLTKTLIIFNGQKKSIIVCY